jgi:hypothetical protein
MTPDIAQALMQDTEERFVRPEIDRRSVAGEEFRGPLWAAQVVLGEEIGTTRVRLNSEVRLLAKVEGTEEWRDYAELRAAGPVTVSEISLPPEEARIRHITMCNVGESGQWRLLFDFAGHQEFRDGAPGLGVVFNSPDASNPPMTKLRARVEQLFDAVTGCLERDHFESAMILLYSGIDAMAWQYDWVDPSFVRLDLPRWGRALYELMFAPAAPHATTHILSRDYARRTIEIALLHHPDLLTEEERGRITPPFAEGGIREWGESEDRDKDKYREGNAPLGMDFENYTLGHLVEDRSNYDYNHPGFQKVRANVLWRLYDLGFTLERFGQVDQWIARGNWSRSNDPNKVERYGKKYARIAYFELAGFIEDQGALAGRIRRYGGARISDTDIDPSFPEKAPEYRLVHDNYLGDNDVTTQEWINDGGLPDVHKFLVVDELIKEAGPWVLLDGYINQEDKQLDRNRFTFIRTLLIREGEAGEIISRLARQDMKNRWLPEIPEDYYLFAGEMPWCDLFPENEWSDLEFTDSEQADDADADVEPQAGTSESDHAMPKLLVFAAADGSLKIIDLGLSDDDRADLDTVLDEAQEALESEGKEAFEESVRRRFPESRVTWLTEPAEVKRPEFQALVPLREYSWESYHSVVNLAGVTSVLARQLTDSLDLKGQPQTFDMFDTDGKRASVTLRYGEEHWNSEHFVYIRRDLLDRFLEEQGLRMVWVTWGERQYSVSTMANRGPAFRGKGEAPWRVFQQVTTYLELSEPAK